FLQSISKFYMKKNRMDFIHKLRVLKTKMLGVWDNYIRAYGKSVKDGYVSNAYAPLVWFVIFLIVPLVVVTLVAKNQVIQYICAGLFVVVIIFTLVMYVVLLLKNPKLLQSEWYRLESKRLDLISQQGDEKPVTIDLVQSTEIRGNSEEKKLGDENVK